MRIELEQTTAIAIDYQERLMPVMHERQRLMENSCILLAGLKELGVPICLTQQYTRGLGMTIEEITNVAGTTDYIEKISYSAYEQLHEALQGKKYVIVCGIESHICVLQTVIDLIEHHYIPVLVTDCITSRKPEDKEMAIQRASNEGAIITTYEAILFELLKKAGSAEAKRIQRIIK
ncbi:MAG: isochorismatase family protein [Lachnospiraceae bacterium]